jgi:RNA polymerase sigma-70 factor (ECF subfamily)
VTDEQVLIKRAQGGEMDAFGQLVERSKINVYRLAYDLTGNRHDAEDLSQDVFVKAHRSLQNFRGEATWSTWIYRITVNTCLDHRRSKTRETIEYRDDLHSTEEGTRLNRASTTITPDRSADSEIVREHIERALDQLPGQERAVFVLRHYHDLPLGQIAQTLNIAEGTVKSHLFRAIRRLQRELDSFRNDMQLERPS